MPSSPTSSLRIEKPNTGELINVWGAHLDTDFDLLDAAIAGWTTKALTGNYTLTSANYAADEARSAMLKFTGTGAFTVTVPAVSKRYDVWNACSGVLTITNGSASVTLQPGEVVGVVNDGNANMARVQPTDFGGLRITSVGTPTATTDATNKSYVDGQIAAATWSMGAFGVPTTSANNGQFLGCASATPGWQTLTVSNISDYVSDQATRAAAIHSTDQAIAIAFAAAL